jgi:S1-C subfamily serine protease
MQTSCLLGVLLFMLGPAQGMAQLEPGMIEKGKKATVLVEGSSTGGWSGSAFCVDKSGLFLTNAHVASKAIDGPNEIHLVLDVGAATQRRVRAKVVRHDEEKDLALLKVDQSVTVEDLKRDAAGALRNLIRPQEALVFTPLELGTETDLIELADVASFGYPFGTGPRVGRLVYPAVTVLPSHISSLRKSKGRLLGIQIDSQLNPGSSGGPVLDASGKVIGVVAATVPGAAMNLAIPVGRMADFMAAPGVVFDPPPLSEQDRDRQVTWTIRIEAAKAGARIPEDLSVVVTLPAGSGEPRTFTAQPEGSDSGAYTLTLSPLSGEPPRGVELLARLGIRGAAVRVHRNDGEVAIGGGKFRLSELRAIYPTGSPHAETVGGKTVRGQVEGLDKVRTMIGQRVAIFDLSQAAEITVRAYDLHPADIVAQVEAKQGSKVLATIRKRIKVVVTPATVKPGPSKPS